MKWLNEYCPRKHYWSTFKRCTRRAFSPQTPPNKPTHYSPKLKTRLGKWFNVQINTWSNCYRSKESLYLRQEDKHLRVLKSKGTPGVYSIGETVRQLSLDTHPISHKRIGKDVWTRTPNKANVGAPTRANPPGLIYEVTLGRHTRQVVAGSNGSVYSEEKIGSAALMIQEGD